MDLGWRPWVGFNLRNKPSESAAREMLRGRLWAVSLQDRANGEMLVTMASPLPWSPALRGRGTDFESLEIGEEDFPCLEVEEADAQSSEEVSGRCPQQVNIEHR